VECSFSRPPLPDSSQPAMPGASSGRSLIIVPAPRPPISCTLLMPMVDSRAAASASVAAAPHISPA